MPSFDLSPFICVEWEFMACQLALTLEDMRTVLLMFPIFKLLHYDELLPRFGSKALGQQVEYLMMYGK